MYVHWLDGMSVRGDAARLMYPHTTRRMALYRSVLAFCSSGLALVAFVVGGALSVTAQQVDPALLSNLQWRLVGPFRGGRAITATGVPGNPSVYYFGAVGGGVWKTTDAGVT